MDRLKANVRTGLRLFAVFVVLAVSYTMLVTLAGLFVPEKTAGSLIIVDGKVVGSALIGQSFTSPRYFHGRPSAVDYRGDSSGGSNFGPTNKKFLEIVAKRIELVRQENNLPPGAPVPADLVLASGSGLDPDISVHSAMLQVGRVARARNLEEGRVAALVEAHIESPEFGLLGQHHVNVLRLNLALDELR